MTSRVPSVDPPSMTNHSYKESFWARTDSAVRRRPAALFKTTLIMENRFNLYSGTRAPRRNGASNTQYGSVNQFSTYCGEVNEGACWYDRRVRLAACAEHRWRRRAK